MSKKVIKPNDFIKIRGARVHNLKNISVDIPKNKLVVISGLSGSGKSSLAFDTLFAEGQRRFVESLSSYARQFLGVIDKPDVDRIDGLSPAISIDQKSLMKNPRSTVGTITEIYDYLRLIFARIGKPHCPNCFKAVSRQTVSQITDQILANSQKSTFVPSPGRGKGTILILAPLVRDRKGEYNALFKTLSDQGYQKIRIDNEVFDLEEIKTAKLEKNKKHKIELVVDRMPVERDMDRMRIVDSIEQALKLGQGIMFLNTENGDLVFSEQFACHDCGLSFISIEPRTFSFNTPHGACSACTGLGKKLEVDPTLVIPNKNLTLAEGAIRPWAQASHKVGRQSWYFWQLEDLSQRYNFSLNKPVAALPKNIIDLILYGERPKLSDSGKSQIDQKIVTQAFGGYEGVIPNLERRWRETDSEWTRSEIERYMFIKDCPACLGQRLKPEALAVKIDNANIAQICGMSLVDVKSFFTKLSDKLSVRDKKIASPIIKEILARLNFLIDVGLNYLTLDRSSQTLAGGEAQRIRLATQIGSGLSGVLYILDEPSIGLHARDHKRLLSTLQDLKNLGNSIIVVEHDAATLRASDWVIDVGPEAGERGGRIIFEGTPKDLLKSDSLTGLYLSGRKEIAAPSAYREGSGRIIKILGASHNNLKNIDVEIPLGKFVCISGVSGSGKSTLIDDILVKALYQKFYGSRDLPGAHKKIEGMENLDKVVYVDQSPIGRTPRSNPATYCGAFNYIREFFAGTPQARALGYRAGRFSFNVKGGRCEACEGQGQKKIEMHFLPDIYVECEECKGSRFNKEALAINYKDRNIFEVLNMSIDEAYIFFKNIPALRQRLETLKEVGLGYVKLGQPAPTLSGGEAQRVKLATELAKKATGKTLYLLDEPTTGLHFEDINRLLNVLQKLVDRNNTVLVIEHHLDVLKNADYIIDLGPEGGDAGGEIVALGTPKEIAANSNSYTGQFLAKII